MKCHCLFSATTRICPRRQSFCDEDFVFYLFAEVLVVDKELSGLFPALAEADFAETQMSAGFFDYVAGGAEVDQVAFVADAVVEHNVEFGFAERRGDFVFDDPGPDPVADGAGCLP